MTDILPKDIFITISEYCSINVHTPDESIRRNCPNMDALYKKYNIIHFLYSGYIMYPLRTPYDKTYTRPYVMHPARQSNAAAYTFVCKKRCLTLRKQMYICIHFDQ